MPTSEILIKNDAPIVWAGAGYDPDAGVVYAQTEDITLTGLPDQAARQGTKADGGVARAGAFRIMFCPEFDAAPTAGNTVEVYFSITKASDAGVGNPGMLSGTDAAYTGTTAGSISESVKQLVGPFVYVVTPDVAPISLPMDIGVLYLKERYVSPLVVNNGNVSPGGQAFEGDDVEMFLALIPIKDESQ